MHLIFLTTLLLGQVDPPEFPRTPPTTPSDSIAKFQTVDGFRMLLIAAEPIVLDPVAAAYDEDGRLYVVEMSDYPHVAPENDVPFQENKLDPPIGRLKLITDTDNDGIFDKSTILADKLSWPTGIALWKGGAFVAATPDIWYIKDTDGDGKADIREKIYTGFRKFNIQAVMNNLQWGLDHKIYGAGSSNGGEIKDPTKTDLKGVTILRRDFKFDPNSRNFEAISGGARFGNTFDDWGNRFICDIRNPLQHVVLPASMLERNKYLVAPKPVHDVAAAGDTIPMYRISPPEPWREFRAKRWAANGKAYPQSELVGAGYLTSSSGVTIYRGDAYAMEYHGQAFLGEVANNLIHRQKITPDGVTFKSERIDEKREFIASTDTWFRPVNFVHAPDGTLNVLDMYRETIEHPWSIPDDIKAGLDLRSGEDKGRIYRITPPGFARRKTPKLSEASGAELVALLDHPNAWHWETAHRLIFERQDKSLIPAIQEKLLHGTNPLGRLRALYSLAGLGVVSDQDVLIALKDESPGVREHAISIDDRIGLRSEPIGSRLIALANDSEPRVRFRLAFALSDVRGRDIDRKAQNALINLARADSADLWIRTALLSSINPPARHFHALARSNDGNNPPLELLRPLAVMAGESGSDEEIAKILELPTDVGNLQPEIVLSLSQGLTKRGKTFKTALQSHPKALILLNAFVNAACKTVVNSNADLISREQAASLIALGETERALQLLPTLIDPAQPAQLQQAAIKALTSIDNPEVGLLLVEKWPNLLPLLRTEMITRLLTRPAWTLTLLKAIDAGKIPSSVVPASRRTLLLADKRPETKELASKLFGKEAISSRAEAYKQSLAILDLKQDKIQGLAVFDRECLSCHRLGDRGNAVGPNLASITRRTPEEVLLHIVDPNREVSPDFLEYVVALKDGRSLTGIIVAESAGSLILRRSGGMEDTVNRAEIDMITGTGKSLMPEGLESKMTNQEMADLIAYLLVLQK